MLSTRCWLPILFPLVLLHFVLQSSASDTTGRVKLNEKQIAELTDFLQVAEEVRKDDYGNVHYVMEQIWLYQDKEVKRSIVSEIKYWSRNNKYFRLDTRIIESIDPLEVGNRTRLVISPDGFVSLKAKDGRPFVINEWGNSEQGLDWLFGNYSILASVRFQGLALAEVAIGGFVDWNLSRDIPTFLVETDIERILSSVTDKVDGQTLVIKWLQEDGVISYESSMSCDVKHGVVLSYEGQSFRNGILGTTYQEKKDYEFEEFRGIPSYYHYRAMAASPSGVGKYSRTINFKTKLVDWTPVPLGIFSLEAQGLTSLQPQSVWSRRMWILLAGAFLFGVVYLIKRAKYRAI